MVKKRTPTICEWALGFTIEDYMENKERRKSGPKRNGSRFKLEVSTDDESGEDSLKITYPRAESPKGSPGIKKVRFEKESPKSALKKAPSDTETSETTEATTETETSACETEKSSDSGHSDSSRSSSGKKKSKKHLSGSESSNAETSGTSDSQSDCACQKCRKRRRGHLTSSGKDKKKKKTKTIVIDSDSSSNEEDDTPKRKPAKSKKANKQKKTKETAQESDNDAEDESSSEEETPKKTKKGRENKSKKADIESDANDKSRDSKGNNGGGNKDKKKGDSPNADNNVGPAKDKEVKGSPEKSDEGKRKKKHSIPGKLLPEALAYSSLRRPNLIMPVRAEVLQVEHAIETTEDPRPNAFHDGHHGVVRVYHGPAYGNPTAMLYPIRDPTQAALPVGVPHPTMNSYLHGFKEGGRSGNATVQGQSTWAAVAANLPGGSPVTPPAHAKPPSPPMANTAMAGAPNPSPPLQYEGNTSPRGWGQGGYPINVNMYSYGSPVTYGRERGGKKDQRSIFEMMSGSCANNAGPAMYDRAAHRNEDGQGSHRGGNNGGRPQKVHPDLQWSPQQGQAQNATGKWVAQQSNAGWGGNGDGNDDFGNTNNNTWGSNNGNNNTNVWENNNATGWGNNNNDNGNTWANTDGNGSNGSNRSHRSGASNNSPSGSNRSNKSNTSKRSNQPPNGNATNWGDDNNVGVSSRASNASKDSKGSRKSAAANAGAADFDNNAGPVTAAADDWSKTNTQQNDYGSSDPSSNMPGAWEKDNQGGAYNATFTQTGPPADTGGFSWGDTSAAQGKTDGGGDITW